MNKNSSFKQDWFPSNMDVIDNVIQLTITFFGVFLGFVLAREWDKSKYRTGQKEIKEKTINSLIEELKENHTKIQGYPVMWDQVANNTWKGNYTIMSTSAFESIVNSGRFSVLSDKLQSKISDLYIQIEYCNSTTRSILDFPHSSGGIFKGSNDPIKPVITKRDETKSLIVLQIPTLLFELDLEKRT